MGWIVKAVPVATLVEIGQHANSGTLCEFNQYKEVLWLYCGRTIESDVVAIRGLCEVSTPAAQDLRAFRFPRLGVS
jgi:hypothetical protein